MTQPRRRWTKRHKVTLGIVAGLFVLVCGMASIGAIVGDPESDAPSQPTTPAETSGTPAAATTTDAPAATEVPPATTSPAEQPPPPPPPATEVYYANCAEARAAGAAPLHRGDAGYRSGLDRDGDGVACET